MVVDASELVPVVSVLIHFSMRGLWIRGVDMIPTQPDGLAPEIAACATDSLLTAYNAIHNVAGVG